MIGAALAVVILLTSKIMSPSDSSIVVDPHGYVFFVALLLGGVLGALFGLAASLGALLKKKFEGDSR
jgi:hypothetical protein